MPHLPPDTKALRLLIVVGFLAFLIGMAGVLFLTAWLMWRFAEPDTHWYDLLHISLNALLWSVIGGLALAVGATWLLSWWQYRRGIYHCPHCGRTLKSFRTPCDCPAVQALKPNPK